MLPCRFLFENLTEAKKYAWGLTDEKKLRD